MIHAAPSRDRWLRRSIVALALAAPMRATAQSASSTEFRVTGGLVRGVESADGSLLFLGVPYAAPPVGVRRWAPPAPVVPWTGVRAATDAPPPCTQLDEGWNTRDAANGSEDCLYLSVRAPRHVSGARLPVMVWIHGGSNRAGSGYGIASSPIYTRGMVVVGIEYRLGALGFLGAPELRAESAHASSGNYGLLDQIAALEWVRHNISAFGGDPAQVTVAGQSAGAVDIGLLLRSPLARGSFSRVIYESGELPPARSAEENERIGASLLTAYGFSHDAAGLAKLRAAPATEVMKRANELIAEGDERDRVWMGAAADGWVLPIGANDLYRSDGQTRVPMIVGNVQREVPIDLSLSEIEKLARLYFRSNASKVLALYDVRDGKLPPNDPTLGSVGTQLLNDALFTCPINRLAAWQVAAGQKVWRYEFSVPAPGSQVLAHTAELRYVFDARPAGTSAGSWPPVQDYWANFIKTGDPNGEGLPQWPDLAHRNAYMRFTLDGPKVDTDLRGAICRLAGSVVQ